MAVLSCGAEACKHILEPVHVSSKFWRVCVRVYGRPVVLGAPEISLPHFL